MIENIASGLLLAAITGVVWVAYRHPSAFAALHKSVKRPVGMAILVLGAFALGDDNARVVVRSQLARALPDSVEGQKAIATILDDGPHYGWIWLGMAAIWVFLEALASLPRLGIVSVDQSNVQLGVSGVTASETAHTDTRGVAKV